MRVCSFLLCASLIAATSASAQELSTPTPRAANAEPGTSSADSSVIGANVIASGDVALFAGLGWPGFFGELKVGLTSRADIGFRGSVYYGAPLIGFETSTGGAVSVPIRVALRQEQGGLSALLVMTPFAVIGEATLVGGDVRYGDSLGYALGTDLEFRFSGRVRSSTLMFGAASTIGWRRVKDAGQHAPFMTAQLMVGAEARMTDETRLFIEVAGGYALLARDYFGASAIAKVALGVVYLL